ncbi:MAG: ATPase [Methylococcaceae bacterium]|nr:ATPase [Methylococcaceae bacterium]
MTIVALKKITLCGLRLEKNEVLEKLQVLGSAHLIPLNKQIFSTEITTEKLTKRAVEALKYLIRCTRKRHQINNDEDFDLNNVVQQALQIQTDIRTLNDQRDFLIKRIEEIKPWGDFNLSTEDDLGGVKFWFYIVPKRLMKQLKNDLVYQVVHVDNTQCFVVVLSEQEPPTASVPVLRTHTGKVPLSVLKRNLQAIELAIEDKQAERQSLTRWISLIAQNLAKNENAIALKVAKSLSLDDKDLFMIQAWVPVKKISIFEVFAKHNGLVLMVEDLQSEDLPPTLLENSELLAGGEEVVKFYQTPAYNDWDPSMVLFFSFAFFFAMILSDAGYAAFFGFLLALKWKNLGKAMQGKRLRMLALVTIIFSIIWGILTGGYFGFSPTEDSFAGSLKILDINDFDSMMRLSIAVGAIHIILANLIKVYQSKTKKDMVAALGWICLVVGGFLLWLVKSGVLNDQLLNKVAISLLIMGSGLLLFFSSERIIKKPSDAFLKILDGLKNITGITKIFGDILSYMRLFALGLASTSLALTFNQLAEQVYSSASGLGLLSSILILILGHSLNLMLCLMSGVVHGLRLNFIEFYNWSVSDEGYAFKAFSNKGGV